ncbi:hypothetical protein HUU59_10880 [bacterium]|nr:hypothetical protein [bacterium]
MTPEQNYEQIMTLLWWVIGVLVLLVAGFAGAWATSITRSLHELKASEKDNADRIMSKIDELYKSDSATNATIAVHNQKIVNLEREVFKGKPQ